MCGITGWVAWDRDLRAELPTVEAMTATMTCRGPDDGAVRLWPHAAFGHRRLAVIDLEGGAQPMLAESGGTLLAAITFSGEIYNYRELRAELESHGHLFRTASDTEIILQAYLRWGAGCAQHLNGMFAFGIWDALTEELFLVRDRLGVKPLFYYPVPDGGLLFGSEPKAILAHPATAAAIGLDGLRETLAMFKTPGHALYRGMAEVLPGHVVRVTRTGITRHRYWALEATEHTDDLETTVATVRELLEDIVRRQLVADVPLCSLLSGGLDSSVITALAARELASAGAGPIRSFAVDYTGQAENFRPDGLRSTPDGPFAQLLAEHAGASHQAIVLDAGDLIDRRHREAVLTAKDRPSMFAETDVSLYLLFRRVRQRSTVALSGEAADEVFGGYSWFHSPAAVDAGTFPWIAATLQLAGSGIAPPHALLDPAVVAELDLAAYTAGAYSAALTEVPHLPGVPPLERRMREVCYLHLTRLVTILLDRKDRMSMATGLEVRVPFCDHRLVQYVFNTPWWMKTFDGREKSLLRAAAGDLLPPEIAGRLKSPYPTTQDPRYPIALHGELSALADDDKAPVWALADRAAVQRAVAEPGDMARLRTASELVLGLDAWLRGYQISLPG